MPARFATLDGLAVAGKTVLVRSDLNVPMEGGRITDATRITRLLPTLHELELRARRWWCCRISGGPRTNSYPSLSLSPLVDTLAQALGREVRFGVDCIGPAAREAVDSTPKGVSCCWRICGFMQGRKLMIPPLPRGWPNWAISM